MHNESKHCDNPKLIPMCGQPAMGGCALWRRVLTMEEAAQICSVHRTTLTRFARAGDLKTHMIGERRLVDEKDLARFIEKGRSSVCKPNPGESSTGDGVISTVGFPVDRICAKKEKSGRYICPLALTVKEAALALRIHWANLAKYVATGELKSVKLGAARRVFAFELWLFFENHADGKAALFDEKEAS